MNSYDSPPAKNKTQLPYPQPINTAFNSQSKKYNYDLDGSPKRIVRRNASNESLEPLRRAPVKDTDNMPSDRKNLYASIGKDKASPFVCNLFAKGTNCNQDNEFDSPRVAPFSLGPATPTTQSSSGQLSGARKMSYEAGENLFGSALKAVNLELAFA